MTRYKSSLCGGSRADPSVRTQDPWKGLRVTTKVPTWCGHHLRLGSACPAWVPCPAFSISSHLGPNHSLPPLVSFWLLLPSRWWPGPRPPSASDPLDALLLVICSSTRSPVLPAVVAPWQTHSPHSPLKPLPQHSSMDGALSCLACRMAPQQVALRHLCHLPVLHGQELLACEALSSCLKVPLHLS